MLAHIELSRHHDDTKFVNNLKIEVFQFFAFPRHEVPSISKKQPLRGYCLREICREAT